MHIRICLFTLTAAITCSTTLFAHGEDALGPHHGFIKMPGAYHIEVVPGKDTLDVMLLDANFKNATVLNSHIKVKINNGKNSYALRCESMDNYFSCPISAKLLAQGGKLQIESERQLNAGMPVEYSLPLQVEKAQA